MTYDNLQILDDGTLVVHVESGKNITRVLVEGDDHYGCLYYPDED